MADSLGIIVISGNPSPVSHLDIVLLETPSLSASCFCVNPSCLRSSAILFPTEAASMVKPSCIHYRQQLHHEQRTLAGISLRIVDSKKKASLSL